MSLFTAQPFFEDGPEPEDDEPCRECGEPYDHFGDGWHGMCPSCADRADPDGAFV